MTETLMPLDALSMSDTLSEMCPNILSLNGPEKKENKRLHFRMLRRETYFKIILQ